MQAPAQPDFSDPEQELFLLQLTIAAASELRRPVRCVERQRYLGAGSGRTIDLPLPIYTFPVFRTKIVRLNIFAMSSRPMPVLQKTYVSRNRHPLVQLRLLLPGARKCH